MHIHWHRRIANPFEPAEPTDYEPTHRSPWKATPTQCRCGHRKVDQAQPMNGYVGMPLEVSHWLHTGEWVDPKELERRMRDQISKLDLGLPR